MTNSRGDQSDPFARKSQTAYVEQRMFDSCGTGQSFRWTMALAGEKSLTKPFVQHPWVYACVASIGKAVAGIPLQLQRERADGSFEPVTDGPLYRLFARPNKLMSQRKFLRSVAQTQQLYGETFLILMERSGGNVRPIKPSPRIQVPDELWPVRGDMLEEILDPDSHLPVAWRLQTASGTVTIPDESLIQIAEANPYNPLRGVGPMQAAYRTAAKDFVLDRYDEALLQNGGSPGGVLSVDGHLTDADSRAIKAAWREAHERPDQHRKTAVLPQGTSYEEIGFSPQEMEFGEMREWNRQTIMSIFGVTKPILGLTEGVNYASSMAAFRAFYEVTITPFLDFLQDELETKFISRLVGPESGYRLHFDLSGVPALREDADSKAERALAFFTQGGRTFREAAELAGWDIGDTDLEHADTAYMSSSMVAVGEVEDEEEMPALAPEELEDDEPEELEPEDEEPEELEPEDEETEDEARALNRAWPAGLESPLVREKYWREWDQTLQSEEEKLARGVKRVLREMTLAIRRRVRELADGPWKDTTKRDGKPPVRKMVATEAEIARLLKINMKEWEEAMLAETKPRVTNLILTSAEGVHFELGTQSVGFFLNASDPAVVRYIASKEMLLVGIPNTLMDEVQRALVRILAEDSGVYTSMREAIYWTLANSEEYLNATMNSLGVRSSLIARTETTGAANYGRQQQLISAGIKTNIWMAQPVGSTRPSHVELDGREVPIGQEFGYGLRFPGDPNGGASEVCNCRCVLLPGNTREQ
jgi:HK97 family phage portal protein